MENRELFNLVKTIRNVARQEGIDEVAIDKLESNPKVETSTLKKYFSDDKQIAQEIFKNEQQVFEKIFSEENFENNNAIDKLLKVSKMIAKHFSYLTPVLYHHYQEKYPLIFQQYFDQRAESVFRRIQENLVSGMQQGYYRNDLSVELVARGYISRLIDLYNPTNFPAEEFSFDAFFNQMFETFVLSIVTEKGKQYWESKREVN
ncbi:MAG: hypothetical protein DRJ09_07470 [Bacteroidetes bacterium]|nr:MAG: hypothetical protein DRJ09_07470 [Bacteroidota bacterium]